MKKLLKVLGTLLSLLGLLMLGLMAFAKVSPVAWTPGPLPALTGQYEVNSRLAAAQLKFEGVGIGPEDVARGPDNIYYSGLEDGRIVRFTPDGSVAADFVNTGGRPLGMQFDADGNLIVADAIKGLLSVSPEGRITVLVDTVADKKMLLVDDLDIAQDGTIWFSDATMRFGFGEYFYDFVEASATGRLLSYTPSTGRAEVHMDGLFFANGVALGPDDAFVLVTETGSARIQRLWLKGARAGQREVFLEGLPGNPDNVSFNGSDTFWVALPALRLPEGEALAGNPWLRRLISWLPLEALANSARYGMVLGLGLDGIVKYNLQAPEGTPYAVTSVNEFDGALWLGSHRSSTLAVIQAPTGQE